jgi:hypothetical protein
MYVHRFDISTSLTPETWKAHGPGNAEDMSMEREVAMVVQGTIAIAKTMFS